MCNKNSFALNLILFLLFSFKPHILKVQIVHRLGVHDVLCSEVFIFCTSFSFRGNTNCLELSVSQCYDLVQRYFMSFNIHLDLSHMQLTNQIAELQVVYFP